MPPRFEHGLFTLSLDFELVWGSRDLMDDPRPLVEAARVVRAEVFPGLLRMLSDLGIVATWATVGHLFLAGATERGGTLHPGHVPPRHAWRRSAWLEGVPAGTETSHPAYYARSLVRQLRDAGQEVGCHSFTHAIFGDPGCSRRTAESEVERCVAVASELGIQLRSFVFPRNDPGHLDVIARHGFTCWRGEEPAWYHHAAVPKPLRRAARLGSVALGTRPPAVLPFLDQHGLWCIPASDAFLPLEGLRRAIPLSRRVERGIAGIDHAVETGRIYHFWFHPINLAPAPTAALAGIRRILEHAARRREAGDLEILPMAAVAARAQEVSGTNN